MRLPNQRGVTLLEMLMVLSIMAIVSAVVFPSVTSGLDSIRLRTTAERLGSTFRFARDTALHRQIACQVTVDPVREAVSLEEIDLRQPNQARSRTWEMPIGVKVQLERPAIFIFGPDGNGPQIRLALVNSRGRLAKLETDALTGLPEVTLQ